MQSVNNLHLIAAAIILKLGTYSNSAIMHAKYLYSLNGVGGLRNQDL